MFSLFKSDSSANVSNVVKVGKKKSLRLRTGSLMPMTGLGTWEAPEAEVGKVVQSALDAGCRHIDCASVYCNEWEIGPALTEWLAKNNVPRSSIFVTSKLWNDRRRAADVREALDKTLADLQLSYLDLYLIHWPVCWQRDTVWKNDYDASLKEAWETMEQLVDEGKVKNIGVSNYNEEQIAELLSYARIKPSVNQVELHPLLPQTSLVSYCQENDIAVTAYSPLGRSALLDYPVVKSIAEAHSVSSAAVLLRWNIQRDVIVIPKTSNPERAKENETVAWAFALSQEEMVKLDDLADGTRMVAPPFHSFPGKTNCMRGADCFFGSIFSVIFSFVSFDVTQKKS